MRKPAFHGMLLDLQSPMNSASKTFHTMMEMMYYGGDIGIAAFAACNKIGLTLLKTVYSELCYVLETEECPALKDVSICAPSKRQKFLSHLDEVTMIVNAAVTNRYLFDSRETYREAAKVQLMIARNELENLIKCLTSSSNAYY